MIKKRIIIKEEKEIEIFSDVSELKTGMLLKSYDRREGCNYCKVIAIGKRDFVVKWYLIAEFEENDYEEFDIYATRHLKSAAFVEVTKDDIRMAML